ncbi:NAD-dependent DNA ligase LigA [Pelagicoccus sp. SDUM812003]|uniref:NAD-dependent DNA ligase LigA n=1 Tax=Pelagicoccus sp. SDUM812003 TaxID=3041267 RepID=UPI00280EDC8C|nr:NAD-dependent DNA ligase LigA [Pelagicoccus sp. SDUM812003]MDQ8203778.1 NAD-dependent DNA ligase LigA [Pelagicoccus sp. SDUM812003]
MAELRRLIAYHDDLYYRKAKPEISDRDYDLLKLELDELLERFPELAEETNPVGVGDDRTGRFADASHRVPMLSLRKAYEKADLERFVESVQMPGNVGLEILVEPKLDGVALSVVYVEGRLDRAITRGNGRIGENVTQNVLAMSLLPERLLSANPPELVEIRGEVFVSRKAFYDFNVRRMEMGEEPFSLPRSLVAGSLKLESAQEASGRPLSFLAFGIGAYLPEDDNPMSQLSLYQRFAAWGVPALEVFRIARSNSELEKLIHEVNSERGLYPFYTDGLVLKINDIRRQRELGSSTSYPNWAIACKFRENHVRTKLLGVDVQIGRTGRITPVAQLEAVEVDGSLVRRAALHSFQAIAELDLRIGDMVVLEKAGAVIPSVLRVDLSFRDSDCRIVVPPKECPWCGTYLIEPSSKGYPSCPNWYCDGRVQRRLEHFVSRQGVFIRGIGPATIRALRSSGAIDRASDFYRLDSKRLIEALGVSDVSAQKIQEAINETRTAELWRFIAGLSVPDLGEKGSKELALAVGSLDVLSKLDPSCLETEEGMEKWNLSSIAARSLKRSLEQTDLRATINDLLDQGVNPQVRR